MYRSNWASFVLGIWFFISGLIPSLQAEWNMLILGIVAAVFGFIAYETWQGIVNGLIGVWFFLSAIWFSLILPWNFLILGAAMAILGIWGATTHNTPTVAPHGAA
jgi:hypothetical protein